MTFNPARYLSHIWSSSQWIMLVALLVIGAFMMLASTSEASVLTAHPNAQTISHCGWIAAQKKNYVAYSPRNIRIVQSKLEQAGFSVGRAGIDGIYGRDTRAAVDSFQSRYALPHESGVGPYTAQILAYVSHPIENVRRCKHAAY